MPRKDIDYEFEAQPGDYGLLAGEEFYAVPPGVIGEDERHVFVYLDRPATPAWEVTENLDGTLTVEPPFRIGDHRVYLKVRLHNGIWNSPPGL